MSREYFSHDYNARSDPRLRKLLMKEGIEGIGIYWCIIEMLYEQEGILPLSECESIAFELHTECERIENIIRSDLFIIEDGSFYSQSVIKRLEIRNDKSKSASASANARWAKWRELHANALQTQSEGNAIKEKEIKEKDIKKYIYSDFYDTEIELSNNDENYIEVVKVLYGKNSYEKPLNVLLKMPTQLSYKQFLKIWQLKQQYGFIISVVFEKIENWGNHKKNTTIYGTFLTFIKNDNKNIKLK